MSERTDTDLSDCAILEAKRENPKKSRMSLYPSRLPAFLLHPPQPAAARRCSDVSV
jgi:hypothetical protein